MNQVAYKIADGSKPVEAETKNAGSRGDTR